MVLVVAFSSSLDVAAIEMELGLPLDYNRELQTVGLSNLCSGLFLCVYIRIRFVKIVFRLYHRIELQAVGLSNLCPGQIICLY
jgi:hypothetical protein